MKLRQLKELFVKIGAQKLYAKPLAENDNSKNQVYFGPGFQALNLFPNEGIVPDSSPKNPIFKAKLRFGWMSPTGAISEAPNAQLILYPQYPEVRFSGFLKGCSAAPSELMASRHTGRILFLGVTKDNRVIGVVVEKGSEVEIEFRAVGVSPQAGVFTQLHLPTIPSGTDSRDLLLGELNRIHGLGWIDSKQLDSHGILKPCNAPQCGGFTLEAEFGIPKNSKAEPDYLGWEIKQHAVSNFDRVNAGTITLMTPEPTGGFYTEEGVEAFVRKFGYADKLGREDRLNFGGVHKVGECHPTTQLTMTLLGYDPLKKRITDAEGSVALISNSGEIAAEWAFSGLLAHWSHKHTQAVYVPSQSRTEPTRQYSYGHKVRLAQQTDGLRLLTALASGSAYYDPGIKLENASSATPSTKRRSQFRIASKNINDLYESVETVEV
jgi:hypothetical protein